VLCAILLLEWERAGTVYGADLGQIFFDAEIKAATWRVETVIRLSRRRFENGDLPRVSTILDNVLFYIDKTEQKEKMPERRRGSASLAVFLLIRRSSWQSRSTSRRTAAMAVSSQVFLCLTANGMRDAKHYMWWRRRDNPTASAGRC
jgi:hypothetical protein